ncbi:MAG: ECF transporter S component [Candidatus Izimaplasma sp.]|nr:ECF transporter S component [Candidatus Izimaplasma bacterium]
MQNLRVKEITLTAVLTALIIVLGLVPNLGYISVSPMVGFTIIHIPVFIGAYFGGRYVGGFLGFIFGLTSFIVALTRPVGALDPIFTNPLVSILPRFLVGFFAVDVLMFLKRKIKNSYLADGLYFALMTFIHSVLVITLLYIAGINYWYLDVYGIAEQITRSDTLAVIDYVAQYFVGGTIFGFLITILIVNSILEMTACILVGTPISRRVKKALEE